jgi:hypothetical protein
MVARDEIESNLSDLSGRGFSAEFWKWESPILVA